MKFCEFC